MLRQLVTLLALIAAILFVVPGQVQAGEKALTGVWQRDLVAAGYPETTVRSLEVVGVTSDVDGTLVWRLSRRVNGPNMVGSDIKLVTNPSGRLLDVVEKPSDAARDGALSSLIGDRQIIDYLLKLLAGG